MMFTGGIVGDWNRLPLEVSSPAPSVETIGRLWVPFAPAGFEGVHFLVLDQWANPGSGHPDFDIRARGVL